MTASDRERRSDFQFVINAAFQEDLLDERNVVSCAGGGTRVKSSKMENV